ncbi:unnamed protein product, partial [Ectocarpus sp. 12 AP-2014]
SSVKAQPARGSRCDRGKDALAETAPTAFSGRGASSRGRGTFLGGSHAWHCRRRGLFVRVSRGGGGRRRTHVLLRRRGRWRQQQQQRGGRGWRAPHHRLWDRHIGSGHDPGSGLEDISHQGHW